MKGVKSSKSNKMETIRCHYSNTFEKINFGQLYCKICCKKFTFSFISKAKRHINSKNHQANALKMENIQLKKSINKNNVAKIISDGFVGSNISLKKLRKNNIKQMFGKLNIPIVSESYCRKLFKSFDEANFDKIKKELKGEEVFYIMDDTTHKQKKYFAIIGGKLSDPTLKYLLYFKVTEESTNSFLLNSYIEESLKLLGISISNLKLIITDSASYNTKLAEIFSDKHPGILWVTCFSHFLNNCCDFLKKRYLDIASFVKKYNDIICNTATFKDLFILIGSLPKVVDTRWTTWLKAVIFHFKNFEDMKKIFYLKYFHKNTERGILLDKLYQEKNILTQLHEIVDNFASLIDYTIISETDSFTLEHAYEMFTRLDFKKDPMNLMKYCRTRWENSNILKFFEETNENQSLSTQECIKHCVSNSASVERLFSLLNNLLTANRTFKNTNVVYYIRQYFEGGKK